MHATAPITTLDVTPARDPAARDLVADLLGGARAMVPWLLGVVPFGLVIGVSAARAHIPLVVGWLSGPLIYAGSAQVAAIELLDAGAAPVVVVIAVLAINLRLVMYSASMTPHWAGTPRRWQALAAYLLVDPSFAVGAAGYDTIADRRRAHRHYLGGGITLWVAWLLAIAIGATAGTGLPRSLQLEMVIPLFLVGEVVTKVRDRATAAAAATAALVVVVAAPVPMHLAPVLAIVVGVAAGLRVDRGRP
jgi:predicted branched-subunit amino acid permease